MVIIIVSVPLSVLLFMLVQSFVWWIKGFFSGEHHDLEIEFPAGPPIKTYLAHKTEDPKDITKWYDSGMTFETNYSAGVFPEPVELNPWPNKVGFSESSFEVQCPYCNNTFKLTVRQCPVAVFESGFFQKNPQIRQSLFWILLRYLLIKKVFVSSLLSLVPIFLITLIPTIIIFDSEPGNGTFVVFISLWIIFQFIVGSYYWCLIKRKSVAIRVTREILKQMVSSGVSIKQNICEVSACAVGQQSISVKHGFPNPDREFIEAGYIKHNIHRWYSCGSYVQPFADVIIFSPYS